MMTVVVDEEAMTKGEDHSATTSTMSTMTYSTSNVRTHIFLPLLDTFIESSIIARLLAFQSFPFQLTIIVANRTRHSMSPSSFLFYAHVRTNMIVGGATNAHPNFESSDLPNGSVARQLSPLLQMPRRPPSYVTVVLSLLSNCVNINTDGGGCHDIYSKDDDHLFVDPLDKSLELKLRSWELLLLPLLSCQFQHGHQKWEIGDFSKEFYLLQLSSTGKGSSKRLIGEWLSNSR